MPNIDMRLTVDDIKNAEGLHDNLGTTNKAQALAAAAVIARKVVEILDDKSDNAEREIIVEDDGQREKIIFPDFNIRDVASFAAAATKATKPVKMNLIDEDIENIDWLYNRFHYRTKAHASAVALSVANYLVKQEIEGKTLSVRTVYSDGRQETYEPFIAWQPAAAVLARFTHGGSAPPPAPAL